ncbi:MAG TPA: carboxypeptidase-like regulatory domain-containing protein, partial [Bacteroidales bacterium]|nr:carboxypeptidase-like regulatory domain-containing protein [Bacteroidales bacterium]
MMKNRHLDSLLSFFRKAVILITVIMLSGSFQLFAENSKLLDDQQKAISGRVTDSKGEPITGANILEKGTTNGVISDGDGKYTINVASANSILVFSFVGYTSQEMTVGTQTSINISLAESAIGLDEIV